MNTLKIWAIPIILILLIATCMHYNAQDSAISSAKHLSEEVAMLERYKHGAFVANESHISATETVKTIVFPDKEGEDFDTTCLVYINSSIQKQSMNCQGANVNDGNSKNSEPQQEP